MLTKPQVHTLHVLPEAIIINTRHCVRFSAEHKHDDVDVDVDANGVWQIMPTMRALIHRQTQRVFTKAPCGCGISANITPPPHPLSASQRFISLATCLYFELEQERQDLRVVFAVEKKQRNPISVAASADFSFLSRPRNCCCRCWVF